MNLAALGFGFLVVTIGVIFYTFQTPWVQFNPFPSLTTFRPFYILAAVCWWIGGIFIIAGLIRNNIARVLLILVFSAIMLYLNASQIASLVKI